MLRSMRWLTWCGGLMMTASGLLGDQLPDWLTGGTPGGCYLVFNKSSLLREDCFGVSDLSTGRPVSAATVFHAFSVTKTLTAVLAFQLRDAGLLELDGRVSDVIELPYESRMTIRELLQHRSGLPNPMPLSWVHPADEASFDEKAFFDPILKENPPRTGGTFSYSNLGYVLLGRVVERAGSRPYRQLARERVLSRLPEGSPGDCSFNVNPAQVQATGYIRRWSGVNLLLGFFLDRGRTMGASVAGWTSFLPFTVNGSAYGGLLCTPTGLALYGQALLDNEKGILSASSRKEMWQDTILSDGSKTGMAHGWFVGTLGGTDYVTHAGGGGGYYSELRLYPTLGVGSVLMLNRTGLSDERLLDKLDRPLLDDMLGRSSASSFTR